MVLPGICSLKSPEGGGSRIWQDEDAEAFARRDLLQHLDGQPPEQQPVEPCIGHLAKDA